MSARRGHLGRAAFTLVEVLVVVLIVALVSAVAAPQLYALAQDARCTSLSSTLAEVRRGVAVFRQDNVIGGADAYPTYAQLITPGTVLPDDIPANPLTGVAGVRDAPISEADARTVSSEATYGWAYAVDNAASPPQAAFWANSDDDTTVKAPDGSVLAANEL